MPNFFFLYLKVYLFGQLPKTCIKRTFKKGFSVAKNEIQICSGQLDTFDPYWNEKEGNNVFLLTIAFPQNQR